MAAPGNSYLVTCGTGHRELQAGDPAWVAEQLPKACVWLRDVAGTRFVISGMGRGYDLDLAEAALAAGLALWAAIPFEGQSARWPRAERDRYDRIRAAATRERIVGTISDSVPAQRRGAVVNGLLHDRNRLMLKRSGAVLTLWEPGRLDGGTAATLLAATRQGMPGVHLDPVGRNVNFRLPYAVDLERVALWRQGCGHVTKIGTRQDVGRRLLDLTTAGFNGWEIRKARPRETHDDGCEVCVEELARSVAAPAPS